MASPGLALETIDINQAIRDKGVHWVAGETSLSKLPPEERKRFFMPATFNMPVQDTGQGVPVFRRRQSPR